MISVFLLSLKVTTNAPGIGTLNGEDADGPASDLTNLPVSHANWSIWEVKWGHEMSSHLIF